MNVLMVASECVPVVKTGGLADVVGALPGALAPLGCQTRVMLPNYPAALAHATEVELIAALGDVFGGPARLLSASAGNGLALLLVDAPHLFDRPGNPYLGPDGRDWTDNPQRFAALSLAAARFAAERPDGWRVDVLHCHDWQAGLTPVFLRKHMPVPPPAVFTIHNIAFPGIFPASLIAPLGLPPENFNFMGYEYYGQVSFLKAGLVFSKALTTVSPTYAVELQTDDFGMGFGGLLRARQADLSGILNGIDEAIWNPRTDPTIAATYSDDSLSRKTINRRAVQKAMALDEDPKALLACVVSRLTGQKGLDILAEALPSFVARGGQLALLGAGSPEIEATFRAAMDRHRGRVGARIGYDEPLSHLLLAGSDAILVPSRFEPCGLTQLFGLRYGAIPIVARTGGLADSVIDANTAALDAGVATGIVFAPIDAQGLGRALSRAFHLFADAQAWRRLIRAAMKQPVGWSRSAARYKTLYDSVLAAAPVHQTAA